MRSKTGKSTAAAIFAITSILLPVAAISSTAAQATSAEVKGNAEALLTFKSASAKGKLISFSDVDALSFRSTSVTVAKKAKKLASTKPITIRFEKSSISINAGCNTLNSKAQLSKGILKAKTFASTRMACTPELMTQDTWLTKVFSANPKITKLDNKLTLTAGNTVITFNVYETYGYADTPLGDDNSEALVKATCSKLLANKATESQAQFEAEQNGLIFRVTSREGEDFPVTMDYRVNRMNVKILGGVVVECTQG